MNQCKRSTGFTLLEMLVVLGVFAVLGVISAQLVRTTLSNHETMNERGMRLTEMQRAMTIMNRDILQLSDRGVRDILGDPTGALLIGSDGLMEFTRLGWRNPLQVPRAELQRVAYVLKDGDLYRSWWGMLDRTEDTEPALQRLLSGVERLEFYAVDASGNEHTFWPVTGLNEDDPANRLVGVIARIEVAPFGVVERIWHVPNV